ncbi:helix-turn-helix transcriptional regulator [Alteromonas sp. 5E99-2]|uniref:helix-turn-helix domain-containing protein n=1 Tax=Alteromonas sp. 5E99-2 TaxID=2817683 RepID=UPI001A99F2C5|nr:XRE family transcriptional regulator [Alteromonas sp. 5E99-2]MBO1255018.1 helix-turn-helix transcriptional regulator [Alteromonas sp. 5E99-2]
MNNPAIINQHISESIKHQRRVREWSLDKMSEITGVSKAMLGQIERKESNPTIATLWKIATGFRCSFSSLLSPSFNLNNSNTHHPFDDQSKINEENMKIKTLFSYSPVTKMETFEITLLNNHRQESSAHINGVTEHIHVLSGELTLIDGGLEVLLKEGEQYILNADVNHGYQDNIGKTRFLDIIYYP